MNRLAESGSAYLKSAAHQPVDWYPWGAEAFERARETGRPVLLDIGAVWCHWCHVMDRESYEDPELARLVNDLFVPVKVDRDERPDVDRRYQRAVGAITGQGGWPLTAFLTADGNVFFGGTYFPPVPAHGRPSFREVLSRVADVYRAQRDRVLEQAEQIHAAIRRVAPHAAPSAPEGEPDPLLLELAERALERSFDLDYGGFGTAPKFPNPGALTFLLARRFRTGREHLAEMATRTLSVMARGGIHDQVGGGFHRYAVDQRWIVPHFEKMSYDNAELLAAYAAGWLATGEPLYRETLLDTARFFGEVLTDPAGGFFGSQDADVGLDDDGDYFTWTPEEVDAALTPEEAAVVKLCYHVHPNGEMHHDAAKNVLFVALSPQQIARQLSREPAEVERLLESGLRGLARARAARPAPYVDTTLYVNWNGLCVAAYCRAFRALAAGAGPGNDGEARAHLLDFARRTFERLWAEAWDPERGFAHALRERRPQIWGLLDDQVKMGLAALELFELTGTRSFLERAEEIARLLPRDYEDAENGGFFDLRADREPEARPLAERHKPIEDDPVPSANGTAAQIFLRLATLTGSAAHRETARRTLVAFGREAQALAHHAAAYLIALDVYFTGDVRAVVVGDPASAETRALLDAAWGTWRPHAIVHPLDPAEASGAVLPPEAAAMLARASATRAAPAAAYVCAGRVCAPPTSDPAELTRLLRELGRDAAA